MDPGDVSSDSMLRQAQQVWSMLDDMAENDPRAYKAFMDKQKAEKDKYMAPPEPNMCVQTQMIKPEKAAFYINFCTWTKIPPPANPEEPVKVAGSAIGQLADDKGKSAVTAVAFNEKILKEYGKDSTDKTNQDTLIQIAMDYIENQHSQVKLTRNYKILEKTHKGNIKNVQQSLQRAFDDKDKSANDELSDVLKNFAPLATENPETLIGELTKNNGQSEPATQSEGLSDRLSGITLNTKPTKKGLIEEVSNGVKSLPEPMYELITKNDGELTKTLVLTVTLHGVKSVAECELDISKEDVSLYVEGMYDLNLSLPCPILEEEAKAKFNKKSSVLAVTLPAHS